MHTMRQAARLQGASTSAIVRPAVEGRQTYPCRGRKAGDSANPVKSLIGCPPGFAPVQPRHGQRVAPLAAVATVARPAKKAVASSEPEVVFKANWEAGLEAEVLRADGAFKVTLRANPPRPLTLHWAVNEWNMPAEASWPKGTTRVDDKAVQTPFGDDGFLRLSFPEQEAPSRMVFVLKQRDPEVWINNGGTDFAVQLKPPDLQSVLDKVLAAEGTYTHWSLFQRFILANEVLDAADAYGAEGMAFIFTWLRLSALRQLDWYRLSNYQSKDIAHVQKTIAQRMADKARGSKDPWSRTYARLSLAGLPRGGGNGDDIRMGILNIMRSNGIKEGHRPGHDEPFLEQWHQKLHTNTTPDDVVICEAYLAFLHSGNHGDYWRVLWDGGRLTPEKLASFSKPLTALPHHLPYLIDPFKHYLWILKTTHSGADLDTAMTMAQGLIDGDLKWHFYDMLQNRNEWWVPGKIVELRERLAPYWKAEGASRDLLLLDVSLDSYFRTCVERVDKATLTGDSLIDLCQLVLRNAAVAVDDVELRQCQVLWGAVKAQGDAWSGPWARLALAASQRSGLSLAAHMDTMYKQVQPHADAFGAGCKLDPAFITNFGEEVVRSQPVFMLSMLLQYLEPILRKAAGVANWQIVSQVAAQGEVQAIKSLADVQGRSYDKPVLLLAGEVGGLEDIPAGVQAVLTRSGTDVLSHVAIRARSQGVLLATCFDDAEWTALQDFAGKTCSASVSAAGGVAVTPLAEGAAASSSAAGSGTALAKLTLPKPAKTNAWALAESSFQTGLVGGKSLNLANLKPKLPSSIAAPASVTLPFGTFERVLNHPSNSRTARQVAELLQDLSSGSSRNGNGNGKNKVASGVPGALQALRQVVATDLECPPELATELSSLAAKAGLIPSPSEWSASSPAFASAWPAICAVWASKWSDRAYLSRRARGVPEEDLFMAVLLQQVVPAQYAFVLHTANPVSGKKGELFGEVVVGMGETLVGNYPGRALSFTHDGGEPIVLSLPSKRSGLFAPSGGTLIARSDANGEDLEEFAGAGLYDSVPFEPLEEQPLDYSQERLLFDATFRQQLIGQLVSVGSAVKAAFGGQEQDIEGVWVDGKVFVVQSRPQVL